MIFVVYAFLPPKPIDAWVAISFLFIALSVNAPLHQLVPYLPCRFHLLFQFPFSSRDANSGLWLSQRWSRTLFMVALAKYMPLTTHLGHLVLPPFLSANCKFPMLLILEKKCSQSLILMWTQSPMSSDSFISQSFNALEKLAFDSAMITSFANWVVKYQQVPGRVRSRPSSN